MSRFCILVGLLLVACTPETQGDAAGKDGVEERTEWPPWARGVPSPVRNPLTDAGVALGRRLFYDPILSGDDTIACATCHEQARAFSDGQVFSQAGLSGVRLSRHTPALINLAFMPAFFWDGGGTDLESVAFGPIGHPDEMGQSLAELVDELRADPVYPRLFEAAFTDGLTLPNIVRALAQFQRTLVSHDAPYDRFMAGDDGALSTSAKRGMALVAHACGGCHGAPFFTDFGYANNGLDTEYSDDDLRLAWGRGRITEEQADIGHYKVPTLRNVTVTAPYMHDGRFPTLRAVLTHYRFDVRDGPTVDPQLRGGLPLSDEDVEHIIAFLEALEDETFLSNPRLGPPF